MLPDGFSLRLAEDRDGPALIALVDAIYRDYPGCILLVDEEEPELRSPGTAYSPDGVWWVVERAGRLVASAALRPSAYRAGEAELRKLYVDPATRGKGLGAALVRLTESEALRRGYRRMHLWTDTRFGEAHRLYERLGWHRQPLTRMLDDASLTSEFEYRKRL